MVAALKVRVNATTAAAGAIGGTQNPTAYEAYMRGRFDPIARDISYEVWPAEHHGAMTLLIGSVVAAVAAGIYLHRRRHQ